MGLPATLAIEPCPADAVLLLERDLGVSFALAQVLARRGLTDPAAARRFLAADEEHPASAFAGLDAAIAAILAAVAAGDRITVHGDYDVDGVTSTALLVRALRSIGADVDWFLPSRTEDGYGLREHTVRRLAERGTRLLVLTDCGITAVDEVALARELGLGVVVVDHHQPRADGRLPDAPIVHPVVSGYPFTELCAAGVAYKVAGALLEAAGHDAAITIADLDLVALGTVADCVSLTGENRRLVRAGLRQLARTEKPGLRALMRVAQADPQRVDEKVIGFRLAPRLNAAGRVARADAALELLLTHDEGRAAEIAQELDEVNARRRFEETRILQEAEAQVAATGVQPAYVLAGEGWHPGVIGIVASRIAERHHRPVVVVGVDGPSATGSGRSIPGVDLLAGLQAAAATLQRFGGHRAAAGCTLAAADVPAFRDAFVAHFAATLTEEQLTVRERVDAVVSGADLGHDLAEELGRLAPFGIGNPGVSLLLPAARLTSPRTMGEGKHLRFSVLSGGRSAQAVAFGTSVLPEGADLGLVAATFTLELNEFRGAVEPRLVLRRLVETQGAEPLLVGEPEPGTVAWREAVLGAARVDRRVLAGVHVSRGPAAIDAPPAPGPAPAPSTSPAFSHRPDPAFGHGVRDVRGAGSAATIGALTATGEPVLVVCADAILRLDQCRGRLGGFSLCSWDALAEQPGLADGVRHLVALDPPLDPGHSELLDDLATTCLVHLAWGEAELRCSRDVLDRDSSLRPGLVASYRALRDGADLDQAFGRVPARAAGRMLAVLVELGLVELERDHALVPAGVEQTDLARSEVYRVAEREGEERIAWLNAMAPGLPARAA